MSLSTSLGESHEIALSTARIRYRERGMGRPVVFVHGVAVNADVWRNVVPILAENGFRCIAPDWPLGSHAVPVPDADLTPPGLAALIAEFLEALDLREVILVANDTGGALVQILMTRDPERVGAVVLATVDCFRHFLPPPLNLLSTAAAVPGVLWLGAKIVRLRTAQRILLHFLAKRPIPREIVDSYLDPMGDDPHIRADLRRFLRGIDNRYTMEAAEKFGTFTRPVLLAWATEDRFFPFTLAEQLHELLPNSTLCAIADSYFLVPEDQPEQLAELIKGV
jgi:pimeloyl-ACP methyl ester carboxylesterase